MRGQQRQQPQLGRGQRRRADGARLDCGETSLQPVGQRREDAEVWPLPDNVLDLRQDRRGAPGSFRVM